MNNMEEQLWDYIHGTLSREKAAETERLIATDGRWKKAWENELAFSRSLQQIDLDEPSMGFNYRVMEAIRAEAALEPLKARINPYIIGGIGLFFLFVTILVFIQAFGQINWVQASNDTAGTWQLSRIQQFIENRGTWQISMFSFVVALLFLSDKLLNRRLHEKLSAS